MGIHFPAVVSLGLLELIFDPNWLTHRIIGTVQIQIWGLNFPIKDLTMGLIIYWYLCGYKKRDRQMKRRKKVVVKSSKKC